MIYIDKYAYSSNLKKVDPVQKLVFAFSILGICIWSDNPVISLFVIIIMGWVTAQRGATPIGIFIKLLMIPMVFLLFGIMSVAVSISAEPKGYIAALPFINMWIGITEKGLWQAGNLFFKAMGAASCLGFLSLGTPVVDLISALKRLRIPKLLIELMGLVYRFIFVILETADTIITAQNSRLGYRSLKAGFRSLGAMSAALFLRAYSRSDEIYTALEARGYEGELNVLDMPFEKNKMAYVYIGAVSGFLIAVDLVLNVVAGGLFR